MNKFKEHCIRINEKKTAWNVLKIIGFVILGIGACVLFGFIVMWLWNWIMPMIFGLTTIDYWQAVGIFILSKLLFGGIGGGKGSNESDDKGKGTIRGEIKREIKKEFDKEFDKEHSKQAQSGQDNDEYDRMYDQWWQSEGEKSFDKFLNKEDEPED